MTQLEWARTTLGVNEYSTPTQIRQAYRDLVTVWHPDQFEDRSRLELRSAEMLKRISSAMQILEGENDLTYSMEWTSESVVSTDKEMEPPGGLQDSGQESTQIPESSAIIEIDLEGHARTGTKLSESTSRFPYRTASISCLVLLAVCLGIGWWATYANGNKKTAISNESHPESNALGEPPLTFPLNRGAALGLEDQNLTQEQIDNLEAERDFKPPIPDVKRKNPKPIRKSTTWGFGSSKQEVRRLEGRPKATEDDTWFYGSDSVSFLSNEVYSYSNISGKLKVKP